MGYESPAAAVAVQSNRRDERMLSLWRDGCQQLLFVLIGEGVRDALEQSGARMQREVACKGHGETTGEITREITGRSPGDHGGFAERALPRSSVKQSVQS